MGSICAQSCENIFLTNFEGKNNYPNIKKMSNASVSDDRENSKS